MGLVAVVVVVVDDASVEVPKRALGQIPEGSSRPESWPGESAAGPAFNINWNIARTQQTRQRILP
jgi:hypothetical protein